MRPSGATNLQIVLPVTFIVARLGSSTTVRYWAIADVRWGAVRNARWWWKADIALRSQPGQHGAMTSIADGWWNEDRRDLFRAVEVIASDAPNPDQIGAALDTLLNDLELYDDPRQGAGAWLFDDETQLAERLGEKLRVVVGTVVTVGAGSSALTSEAWPDGRAAAIDLRRVMDRNGDYSR